MPCRCSQVNQSPASAYPPGSGSGGALMGGELVQVEVPLSLVVLTRTPHLPLLFDMLTAMFGNPPPPHPQPLFIQCIDTLFMSTIQAGCYRLALLSHSGAHQLSPAERFQIELMESAEHARAFSSSSSSSSPPSPSASSSMDECWRGGLIGLQSVVDMWRTLADLVYNYPLPLPLPHPARLTLTIPLPPVLRAHLDALTMPLSPTRGEGWLAGLTDWGLAAALHCLSAHQLATLLAALLAEARLLVLDLPPPSTSNPSHGDAFLATSCVLLALCLPAPLRWAGFALSAVPPPLADLLSAPGAFIAALLRMHYADPAAADDPGHVHIARRGAGQAGPVQVDGASRRMMAALQQQLDLHDDVIAHVLSVGTVVGTGVGTGAGFGAGGSVEYVEGLPGDCLLWLPLQCRLVAPRSLRTRALLSANKLYASGLLCVHVSRPFIFSCGS